MRKLSPRAPGKSVWHVTRLRRSDCAGPGISRRGRGRGFEFRDDEGRLIDDPEDLARIRELGIPPAWKDVWICPDPRGHLQATGTDAAGRKQYLYHDARTFIGDLESIAAQAGHVKQDVRHTIVRGDEAETLGRVEPSYGTAKFDNAADPFLNMHSCLFPNSRVTLRYPRLHLSPSPT